MRVWKVGRAQKILWMGYTLPIFGIIAIDLVVTDDAWAWAAGSIAVGLLLWYVCALRPLVVLTTEELVVLNKVDEIVHRLDEIESVEPGWAGLVLRTTYGQSFRAWAVQEPNLNARGDRSRANRVSRAIMAEVERSSRPPERLQPAE